MSEGVWPVVLIGDCRAVLKAMPAESVHCVITSHPYWNLRDYGTGAWEGGDPLCEHQGSERYYTMQGASSCSAEAFSEAGEKNAERLKKARWREKGDCGKCGARRVDQQIGLEPTFAEHLAVMVDVCREVKRVLRSDGIFFLNAGDAYACSPNGRKAKDIVDDDRTFRDKPSSSVGNGFKPKDLMLMPARLAIALCDDGWWLRSEIIWSKLNPLPESVTDRFTRSHEMIYMFTKAPHYFFDQEAIREPHVDPSQWKPGSRASLSTDGPKRHLGPALMMAAGRHRDYNPAGRNKRTVWEIPTQPLGFEHYAAFPEKLVEPLILCSTSEYGVCSGCGAPWRRVVEDAGAYQSQWAPGKQKKQAALDPGRVSSGGVMETGMVKLKKTTGWQPSCECCLKCDKMGIPAHLRGGIHATQGPRERKRMAPQLEQEAGSHQSKCDEESVSRDLQAMPISLHGEEREDLLHSPLCDEMDVGTGVRESVSSGGNEQIYRGAEPDGEFSSPSTGDGRASGPKTGKLGVCASYQRGQIGQSNRESGGLDEFPACEAAHQSTSFHELEPLPTTPATVLDIFAGSGTTLRVATRLGRKSIGIELNPEYVEKILKRRTDQGGLGL